MDRAEYQTLAAVEGKHWWFGGMRAISAAVLDRHYQGRQDLRVLDAGCGTGGNAQFLRRYGAVIGIDLAPEALSLGQARLGNRLARATVLQLPFVDAHFDLVTSFDVLYHRAVPDEAPALAEVLRVLRPDGRLLIRLPAFEFLRSKHDRAVHTRRRYTAAQVRQLLETAGLQVEQLTYVNSLLFPLPLLQRLLERRLPRLEQRESDLASSGGMFNDLLRLPMALEAAWLARGGQFPAGLSVLALARKPATTRYG